MFNEQIYDDAFFNNSMLPADDGDDLSGGDSTDSPTPTAAPDASVLSGQPAPAPAPAMPISAPTQPPPPPAPVAPDIQTTPASDVLSGVVSPSNPNIPLPKNSVATTGLSPDGTAIIPQAAGVPSVWKQIMLGALMGAAHGAGGKGFGQGAEKGADAVEQAQQLKVENAANSKKLQFESMQAANEMIRARNEARAADDAHEEHAQTLQTQQIASQEALEERGILPKVTVSGTSPAETHAQAAGGLQTLADQNGGNIPRVATTNAPDSTSDDGKTHTIHVYNVNPADIQSNPNGTLDLINDDRRVKGLPPLTQSDLQVQAGQRKPGNWRAGAADMANDALQHIYTVPTPSKEPAENAATQAHMQQQLDTYKQDPNANPNTVKVLQAQLDAFSKAAENTRAISSRAESNTTLEQAPSKAEAARQEDVAKQSTPQGQAELAHTRSETAKTQIETKKAQFDLDAASGGAEWKPKVSTDEKKKAELAENIAFNANEVNGIVSRRPDLVGAVAGRYTNVQQMIGSDDPDISQIGVHIHNIAMANSGVHGFRSQQGVEETENLLLNKFKNGPDAVRGAMQANTDSVQTFIDNARPETYKTHSTNGGAANYYVKQATVARNDAGKVHANMTDFKQITPTKEHGNLYTDDGKTWYTQDGKLYQGK